MISWTSLRAPALAGIAVVAAVATSWANWTMFHHDPSHSGSDVSGPADSVLAWSYTTLDTILYTSPVVGPDGTIFQANGAGQVVALLNNGTVRWSTTLPTEIHYSTPAVASDGTVYVGGADGKLFALKSDGTLRWTFTAGGPIKTAPNIAADGTIYFGADDGKLYAVRPDSSLAWTYQTGDTIRSSPAIGPDGTVFFGSEDTYLYALHPDGTLRWRAATGNMIKYCSPAVTPSGLVCFGSYDNYIYGISSSGALKWAFFAGHVIRSSPAVSPSGSLYIGIDSTLVSIDTTTGTEKWKYHTGGVIYSAPAFIEQDTVVCVGSDDGALHAVHGDGTFKQGHRNWRYTVGSPIRSSPALTEVGDVLAGDESGKLWAFGPLSTVSVPTTPVAAGIGVEVLPNPSRGTVEFVDHSRRGSARTLSIYDTRGREVAALRRDSAGTWQWNGKDERGRRLPAGVYFCRLDGREQKQRVVLLR
jgi:outer membrane protein assembly factor BamB